MRLAKKKLSMHEAYVYLQDNLLLSKIKVTS